MLFMEGKEYVINIGDPDKLKLMKSLLNNSIYIKSYNKNMVLYMFLFVDDNDEIILKIGFTDDIKDREKKLRKQFQTALCLVKIKRVNSQIDELKFHSELKKRFPNLFHPTKYNMTSTCRETYLLDQQIIDYFDSYTIDNKNTNTSVDSEISINDQMIEKIKIDQIEIPNHNDSDGLKIEKIKLEEQEKMKLEQEKMKLKQAEIELEIKKLNMIK